MAYTVNEASGAFADFPNTNIDVDADDYQEEGSYTVFYKGGAAQVFSIKTAEVKTIRSK